jgi:hypothetical protein
MAILVSPVPVFSGYIFFIAQTVVHDIVDIFDLIHLVWILKTYSCPLFFTLTLHIITRKQ